MHNIKLELSPPYRKDDERTSIVQQITFSASFEDSFAALKFLGDLQKLVMSYQPEAE